MYESTIVTSRGHSWSIVRRIVNTFWLPLTPDDGVSLAEMQQVEQQLGVTLPTAMHEWYNLVGHRTDLLSDTDSRPLIARLRVVNGMLIIHDLRDVLYALTLDELAAPDPPVLVDRDEASPPIWRLVSPTFSEFILARLAADTCWWAPFTTDAQITSHQATLLKQQYQLFHNDLLGVQLLGDANTLLCLEKEGENDYIDVSCAIRTRVALTTFLQLVGDTCGDVWHNGYTWSHPVTVQCTDVAPLYRVVDSSPELIRVLARDSYCPSRQTKA